MAVRLRLKKLGRKHRPFFRLCAMDVRAARDGKVIEELGYYDPMVPETDARAILNAERIDYWLSVGAQPSEKVRVLIKKYGPSGSHLEKQKDALERLKQAKAAPPEAPQPPQRKKKAKAAEAEETREAEATTEGAENPEPPAEEQTQQ